MRLAIHSQAAPEAIGCYSQAIQHGNTVYLSGQIPLDPQTMTLVSDEIAAQVTQVFDNLKRVAKEAGRDLDAVVKLTVYLRDISHVAIVNNMMKTYFTAPYPARTSIGVAALPKDALVEIDAIMML